MANDQENKSQPREDDRYQKENTLVQLYWAIFETWSAQVDSYWTRTNYFVAFDLASFAGTWVVFDDRDITSTNCYILVAAVLIFLVAVIVTMAWIFNNLKAYDYHIYWWKRLKLIEEDAGWRSIKPDYVSAYDSRREPQPVLSKVLGKYEYHDFTNWMVPAAFLFIWLVLIIALILLRWNHPSSLQVRTR